MTEVPPLTTAPATDNDALWKVIESTISARYTDRFERESRLLIERARLAKMPTRVNLAVDVTDPIAIWRMIQFTEEMQSLPGNGEFMLALHRLMPSVVAWGLEEAHRRLNEIREEDRTVATQAATATL